MARQKLSSRAALLKVLNDHDGSSMTVTALVDAALPLTDLKGKTPRATLSHVLYVNPLFAKVGKGEFKLTEAGVEAAKKIGKSSARTSRPRATSQRRREPAKVGASA